MPTPSPTPVPSLSAPSLPEAFRSVAIPTVAPTWRGALRKFCAFAGPGYLISVGYMDPGNWSTDLAAGSQFNYALLSIVVFSSLLAIFLQYLSLKLGVATGRDLAQACRESFPRPVVRFLWFTAEIAIAACDLAEVIGSAIALKLLFHIPLLFGVCITAADVFLLLFLQSKGFRYIEALIITLIGVIIACFGIQIFLAKPEIQALMRGLLPGPEIITSREMLYAAIGILGATVMPHNLYLHSSLSQTRNFQRDDRGKKEAIFFGTLDSTIALSVALLVNAAILIVAAAAFYRSGHHEVLGIEKAYELLPLLGAGAPVIFAIALLASGQNSTITGTMAGQVVMEGFLQIRLPPVLRRLVTRVAAIVPAIIVTAWAGQQGTDQLLNFSQVVLSMQLSFAVFPLVWFTADRTKMGRFVNSKWVNGVAWLSAITIFLLNMLLVAAAFR